MNKQQPVEAVLGLDTSNYTTSVALTDREGRILADVRRLLPVKEGARGLRQSEAHFLHMQALPELMAQAFDAGPYAVKGVAASVRPRPVEGSYMPVFTAGASVAASIGAALSVPFFGFSHQEGHLEAVRRYTSLKDQEDLTALHLSGGTCELLRVRSGEIAIIGGSLDISLGQLIDRFGVALGLPFPAGPALEAIALREEPSDLLPPIKSRGLWFNLSGHESLLMRHLGRSGLPRELFETISDLLIRLLREAGEGPILFSGGVAENRIVRERLTAAFGEAIAFGKPGLSGDNAVGISLLGGKRLWP